MSKDKEWVEAVGGKVSPVMVDYVINLNRDIDKGPLRSDCSNLARIISISLLHAVGTDIRGDFEEIPGETLGHKLVFLTIPTRGEMAFQLTNTDGDTFSICISNDVNARAALEAKAREVLGDGHRG